MVLNAAQLRASYRRMCLETITVRRLSGLGAQRTAVDYEGAGRSSLYGGDQLVGAVRQGDHKVIVMTDDLVANGLTLPVTTDDKVPIGGRDLAIIDVPKERKSREGTLIAYELTCRG